MRQDSIVRGRGYWVKYPDSGFAIVNSSELLLDSVAVDSGWNMVGSISKTVAVNTVGQLPDTSIYSAFVGYGSDGYEVTDSIYPGNGYWVKMKRPAKLILNGSIGGIARITSISPVPFERVLNVLSFTDAEGRMQSLYFGGKEYQNIETANYELPPRAPEGMFDARFVPDRMIELADGKNQQDFPISLTWVSYPLTARWIIRDESESASLISDEKEFCMGKNGAIRLDHPVSNFMLRLIPASRKDVPKEYALAQNYPNPFNPKTVIRYQLPVQTRVTLRVYNVIGEIISTLVGDDVQEPGYKEVEWDATSQPSGVYFYKLAAGNFVRVKKLLLLR